VAVRYSSGAQACTSNVASLPCCSYIAAMTIHAALPLSLCYAFGRAMSRVGRCRYRCNGRCVYRLCAYTDCGPALYQPPLRAITPARRGTPCASGVETRARRISLRPIRTLPLRLGLVFRLQLRIRRWWPLRMQETRYRSALA
jgi:hypothetical protein